MMLTLFLRLVTAFLYITAPMIAYQLLLMSQIGASGDYFTALLILLTIGIWFAILTSMHHLKHWRNQLKQ